MEETQNDEEERDDLSELGAQLVRLAITQTRVLPSYKVAGKTLVEIEAMGFCSLIGSGNSKGYVTYMFRI